MGIKCKSNETKLKWKRNVQTRWRGKSNGEWDSARLKLEIKNEGNVIYLDRDLFLNRLIKYSDLNGFDRVKDNLRGETEEVRRDSSGGIHYQFKANYRDSRGNGSCKFGCSYVEEFNSDSTDRLDLIEDASDRLRGLKNDFTDIKDMEFSRKR